MKTKNNLFSSLLTGLVILGLGSCGNPQPSKTSEPTAATAEMMMATDSPNCFAEAGDFTFEIYYGADNSHIQVYITAYFPDKKTVVKTTPLSVSKTGTQYEIDLDTETDTAAVWDTELLIQNIPITLTDPIAEGDTYLVKLKGRDAQKPVRTRPH
ncbi:MAG: hypothetical protein Q8M15_06620 [Bacteroidota bacterium]|nr:hypothetical protein [Bacteroidota bacterium]